MNEQNRIMPSPIPLGGWRLQSRMGIERPGEITGAHELPDRLDMGTLYEGSFTGAKGDWQARYRGPEDGTETVLTLNAGRLTLASSWRGHSALQCFVSGQQSWNQIASICAASYPAHLHAVFREQYSRYLLRVVNPPRKLPGVFMLPDGFPMGISIPVHAGRKAEVIDWFESLDPVEMQLVGDASLIFAEDFVSIIGDSAEKPGVPEILEEHCREVTGFDPTRPVRSRNEEGKPVITCGRMRMSLSLSTVLRCTGLLLDSLVDRDLVRPRAGHDTEYIEYCGFLLPGLLGHMLESRWTATTTPDGQFEVWFGRVLDSRRSASPHSG